MQDRSLSVTEVNNYIKRLLEANNYLRKVSIQGEISNLKRASSGHYYFSLKDQSSEISCIMWRSTALKNNLELDNGLNVIINGSVQVYVQRGTYSVIVSSIQAAGLGTLFQIYLKRLEALKEHGWLEQELKKPLPENIKRVGVVTSETGAVIHDIITTIQRRNPMLDIVLIPAQVQGEGAAATIVDGIDRFNELGNVDVIIIGRGGGSMEDLWEFNDMHLAKAIHKSEIPIISAVGHETDITIADLISDLRAPTPTAAAEFVSGGLLNDIFLIESLFGEIEKNINNKISSLKNEVNQLSRELRYLSPINKVAESRLRVDELDINIRNLINSKIESYKNTVNTLKVKIELSNPTYLLKRGYVMVTDKEGEIIRKKEETHLGEQLNIHFDDGQIKVKVEEKDG